MATFQARIEDLVGAIYDSDTDALTQWLNDGVIDVTHRCIMMQPAQAENFMTVSAETITNSNSLDINADDIISVVRENGTNNQWRECRKILVNRQYDVVNDGSLYFATANSPVFMVADKGAINVFPVPSATTDAFKVYYVNDSPKGDGTADSLAYGHSTIGYFPNDKVYLVVIYAAMQALRRAMADNVIAIGTTVVTVVPPDTISDTISEFELAGEFDDAMAKAKDLMSNADGLSGGAEDAEYWIGSEDSEMTTVVLQAAAQELQRASLGLQDTLQEFTADMERFKALKTGYSADVVGYQMEVTAQVQEYTQQLAESQLKVQQFQAQYIQLKQEYEQGFGPLQAQQPQQQNRGQAER